MTALQFQDTSGPPPLTEDTQYRRILSPDVLPLIEQFRYVAYDPNRATPLDWTHEREWRWVARDEERHAAWYDGPAGTDRYPALPLYRGKENGGFFTRIGFLVRTRAEATDLAELLLGLADHPYTEYSEPLSEAVLRNAFVVPLEEVEEGRHQRIEDLSERMRIVATRPHASPELVQRVKATVEEARSISLAAAKAYAATATRAKDGFIADVCGDALVVTCDTATEVTDALLQTQLARARSDGTYVVSAVQSIADQALGVHEAAARAAAEYLTQELGQRFYMESRWD